MTDVPSDTEDEFHRLLGASLESLGRSDYAAALAEAQSAFAIYSEWAEMWDHHLGAATCLRIAADAAEGLLNYDGALGFLREGILLSLQHLDLRSEAEFVMHLSTATRASGDKIGARIFAFAAEAMFEIASMEDDLTQEEVEELEETKALVNQLCWRDFFSFRSPH